MRFSSCHSIILIFMAFCCMLGTPSVQADEFQQVNIEEQRKRLLSEIMTAQKACAAWQATPNIASETACNSATARAMRFAELVKSAVQATDEADSSASITWQTWQTITGTAYDVANAAGTAANKVVIEPICSLSTWLLGTSDEELYGANWKECEATFERLRTEAAEVRKEIQQLKKFPWDRKLAEQVDQKRLNLKRKFEILRQMYRMEQGNIGVAGSFWLKGIGPHIEACVAAFTAQDWADIANIYLNGFDPMAVYNIFKPAVLTQIGRYYVPPLTDEIAQNLTFDILGAGTGDGAWDKMKGNLLAKAQGKLGDKLVEGMSKEFAESLAKNVGMRDDLKEKFFKYLEQKWWDKLPGSPDEAYGKYLATFLMEKEQRQKIQDQFKKYAIDKTKADSVAAHEKKMGNLIGDALLAAAAIQEAVTLYANSEDWKNACNAAKKTCEGFRAEYQEKIKIPVSNGGIDKYELAEDDYVNQRWFQQRPAKLPDLQKKLDARNQFTQQAKQVTDAKRKVAETPKEQEPPVSYATFSSYAHSLFAAVKRGEIDAATFVGRYSALNSSLNDYRDSVEGHVDEWQQERSRQIFERQKTNPTNWDEYGPLRKEAERVIKTNRDEFVSTQRTLAALSEELKSFVEQRGKELQAKREGAIARLTSSPWMALKDPKLSPYGFKYQELREPPCSEKTSSINKRRGDDLAMIFRFIGRYDESSAPVKEVKKLLHNVRQTTTAAQAAADDLEARTTPFDNFVHDLKQSLHSYLETANYELLGLSSSSYPHSKQTIVRTGNSTYEVATDAYHDWSWRWRQPANPFEPLLMALDEYQAAALASLQQCTGSLSWATDGYIAQLQEFESRLDECSSRYAAAEKQHADIMAKLHDLYPPIDSIMQDIYKTRFSIPTGEKKDTYVIGSVTIWEALPILQTRYLPARRAYLAAPSPATASGLGYLASPSAVENLIKGLHTVKASMKKVRISDLDDEDALLVTLAAVWGGYRTTHTSFLTGVVSLFPEFRVSQPILSPPWPDSDPEQVARKLPRSNYLAVRTALEKIPYFEADLADLLSILLKNQPAGADQRSGYSKLLAKIRAALAPIEKYSAAGDYNGVLAYEGNLKQDRESYAALGDRISEIENLLSRFATLLDEARAKANAGQAEVREFYEKFRTSYESKMESKIMSCISDSWSANDGTTLADLETHLRNSFTVFNDISYSMSNLTIVRSGGTYHVSYDVTITGRIFQDNIKHEEKSNVSEELARDSDGKLKIIRTNNGRFWYVQ